MPTSCLLTLRTGLASDIGCSNQTVLENSRLHWTRWLQADLTIVKLTLSACLLIFDASPTIHIDLLAITQYYELFGFNALVLMIGLQLFNLLVNSFFLFNQIVYLLLLTLNLVCQHCLCLLTPCCFVRRTIILTLLIAFFRANRLHGAQI